MSEPTGEEIAKRIRDGYYDQDRHTAEAAKRLAELYLEMADAFKIELCLPKDFELRDKYKKLEAELKQRRADDAEAAGELLIPVPEPGTDMAKMMSANVLMRRRQETQGIELKELRNELDTENRAGDLAHRLEENMHVDRDRMREERNLLWNHANGRVDWYDGADEVAALADKLETAAREKEDDDDNRAG